jgi:hypothetical protein
VDSTTRMIPGSQSGQPAHGDRRAAVPRSRRSLLAAAVAAIGAVAAGGVIRPTAVAAADIVLGRLNTTRRATTVRNVKASATAKALIGQVTTTTTGPTTAGVQGQSSALNGRGVVGLASNGAQARGVHGRTSSGVGVYGEATGSGTGVFASGAPGGFGLDAAGGTAVRGTSNAQDGRGVDGVADNGSFATGVFASSANGYGLQARGAVAINAISPNLIGVAGTGFYAVVGYGQPYGVIGHGSATAVQGIGNGASSTGVYGEGGSFAGDFAGKVRVTGDLEVSGTKSFLIDHPMDPARRTLAHACVEAPEALNFYRGVVKLDGKGAATIRLPAYFAALNVDFGYQLTPIGGPAPGLHVAREIERRSFRVAGGEPGQRVSWVVTAARHDAWTRAHPFRAERRKRQRDVGKFLNPELFDKPKSAGINRPAGLRRLETARKRIRAASSPARGGRRRTA